MISQRALFWFLHECVYLCTYQKWTATFFNSTAPDFALFFASLYHLYITVNLTHILWSRQLDAPDELPSDMNLISPTAQEDQYRIITNELPVPVLVHKLENLFKR